MSIIIAAETQNFNSHFQGDTAILRIYASEDAYSFSGEQITGSQAGGLTWWKEYVCTVVDGVVTIPAVTLPATTTAYPPTLTYSAILYDESGARQNTKLSNFALDPELLTATEDAIITSSVTVTAAGTVAAQGTYEYSGQYLLKSYYNLSGQPVSTSNYCIRWSGSQWQITSAVGAVYYYSTEDVSNPWLVENWTVNTGSLPLPAVTQAPEEISCTWNGVFLTNNTPCIPCNTDQNWLLAWLINYINNTVVPWASTIASGVAGKTYLSKTPNVSYQPEAVGTNEPAWLGVDDSRYLHEWDGDLEAAITAIGASEVTLWVTEENQYTYTNSLKTSGTLTVGTAYDFAAYTGAVTYFNNVNGGTGYSTGTGISCTGGTGSGMKVDITFVSGGVITGLALNAGGSGYTVGDVVTVSGGGGNAKIYIDAVFNGNFTNVGASFLGYPTNFANKEGTLFVATGTTPTSWGVTSLRPCLVVPSNIKLAFSGSGSLRATSGGGIYIKSLIDPGQRRIFTSDGVGKIFVAPGACAAHNLAWWASTTPSGDNSHEFKQLQQSLSVDLNGGTATIPIGDWKTDQVMWTSNVKVMGQAQADIDGAQNGTCIYPADEAALYTGVFSMQQRASSITFEDLLLSANESATVNAFRYIVTISTPQNFTFNRVRFETVCPTPGAVYNTVLKAENSFEEFTNFNFIQCSWTCWDDSGCVFYESPNSNAYFETCQFRPRVGSVGFYAPFAGYITFEQCEWRGVGDWTNLPLSTDRTITTALDLTSGDQTITLNTDFVTAGAQWSREDLGQYIEVAGVTWGASNRARTYITGITTTFEAEVHEAPNSTVANQTVTVKYTGDYPDIAHACLVLETHLEINLIGATEEGFNYFIIDRAGNFGDAINLFGSKPQAKILFDGSSSTFNCVASELYSGALNSTGHGVIFRMTGGQVTPEIVPRDQETYPYPNFRELLSAEPWHLCPNNTDAVSNDALKMGDDYQYTLNQYSTPVQMIRRQQIGWPTTTDPQLSILNSYEAGGPDQVSLQFGNSWPGAETTPWYYYDLFRSLTTGAAELRGNQTGFVGFDINGYIVADSSIKSISAVEGMGYGVGAGGTVTQATNKTTAVTINKVSGQITMNNAALASGATARFFVNNSSTRTNDTVTVVHASAGTGGAYDAWIDTIGNLGGFYINVKNISGGSLSEAIVLNFNLHRGASS